MSILVTAGYNAYTKKAYEDISIIKILTRTKQCINHTKIAIAVQYEIKNIKSLGENIYSFKP
jgi:hypothetical protein